MNTFESIREFIVPSGICDETDLQLRKGGQGGNERWVLWSGVVNQHLFSVSTMHVPRQIAYRSAVGLSIHVDADELHRLNVWLYHNGERLGVQVHSHPMDAYHSTTDDKYPMVTTLGGLSLVVPYFGKYGVRGTQTALFRLGFTGWQRLSVEESKTLLCMQE